MDNQVTAKFFIVTPKGNHSPDLMDVLEELAEMDLVDREIDINAGFANKVLVRLERLENAKNGYVIGELVRKQVENIPPEANDDGLCPVELSDGGGLGHSSAFSYHKKSRSLVIQSNPKAVSHSRFQHYLETYSPNSEYEFEQITTEDSWKRFNKGALRKLHIAIASPEEPPESINSATDTVVGAAANVAEALGGPYITVEISMGRRKGTLQKTMVKSLLEALSLKKKDGEIDVRN